MSKIKNVLVVLILLLSFGSYSAQNEIIKLNNPSFEDVPRAGKPGGPEIAGWSDCGGYDQTPPDIHPTYEGGGPAFGVTNRPLDGETFIGMVTRSDETFESVSQKLSKPLQADQCYEFSLFACRSDTYKSAMRGVQNEFFDFTNPVKIRIWGGNSSCDRGQMLDESPLVASTVWKQFDFQFKPKASYKYITIEVYYKTPVLFPYNGNVLIDKCSPITKVSCDQPLAVVPPTGNNTTPTQGKTNIGPTKPVTPTNPVVTPVKPTNPVVNPTPTPTAPVLATESFSYKTKAENLREGQLLKLENLYFKLDSSALTNASYATLDELYAFLKENRSVWVEVGGHTNGLPDNEYCDYLSTNRARNVAEYLIKRGITKERVRFKGYGKRQPIATNDTAEGRKKNQRVEIKILRVK